MRNKLFQGMLLVLFAMLFGGFSAHVASGAQNQAYAGTWTGSYTTGDGGSGSLSYTLSKDEKGQWRGTVKFTNQDGQQTAELKSLRIANDKLNARIQSPDGRNDVAIEGTFRGNKFEGSYSVSQTGSTNVVETGTWSVTKNSSPKTK